MPYYARAALEQREISRWVRRMSPAEKEYEAWGKFLEECDRIRDRLRALGFEGEDVWTLADAAAERFEQLNGLHAAGRLTIT